ncbi:MAG: sugar phosphate nucleotidyltransferase [Syntrophobacteraceae bacterium]
MRAMILAAGLGTRLLPLTNSRPKALVCLRGVTLLEFWIDRLNRCGFSEVILNAYHLKDRIAEAVSAKQWPIPVKVLNEPVLLGTGGGIRAAAELFGEEPVAVINVDIISNIDLISLYERHKLSGAEVSLVLHDWPEFNNVAVNEEGSVLGFGHEAEAAHMRGNGVRLLAFTGVHFINPSALAGTASGVPGDILNIYRGLIAKGAPPRALFQQDLFWREVGSVESYRKVTNELTQLKPDYLRPVPTGENISIHPEAIIHSGCSLKGSVVAGSGVRISEGVCLEDVILWNDIQIEKGSSLKNCIVADGMTISGSHTGKIFAPGPK